MRIGELANAAGVNVETVRYYQRLGLIELPPRPAGGTRRYPASALARLRFIRRAKEIGFSLKDIALLLSLDTAECADARNIAEAKLKDIESRLADLQAMAKSLKSLIRQCDQGHPSRCPILETLTGD